VPTKFDYETITPETTARSITQVRQEMGRIHTISPEDEQALRAAHLVRRNTPQAERTLDNAAYQEAMARGRTDEAPHPEPGGDVTPPSGTSDPSSKGRPAEPAAAGELTGSPIEGDTRGRPADFSSLLRGTQHATGHSGAPDQAKDDGRAARLAAALRTEVVHANSEITLPNLDRPASRRATTASSVPPAAPGASEHVAYDRSHAAQPPAVPDARRPLLRGYFLRTDEPTSAVKRP